MTRKQAAEWIPVLRKCLREKWNALAQGKAPKTMGCAACDYANDNSIPCSVCPLSAKYSACCDDLYDRWRGVVWGPVGHRGIKRAAPEAKDVRDYIRKVLAKLIRKARKP